MTSEVTHRSFRATWTPPSNQVDTFRVTYASVAGEPQQEVRLPGRSRPRSFLYEGFQKEDKKLFFSFCCDGSCTYRTDEI